MNALTAPTATPTSSVRAMAIGIGTPAFISMITTTPENAIMPPIDRSTPPAIRTTVSPIARMRKIDADFRTLMKLASEKKFVLVSGIRLNSAIAINTRMIARNAFWRPKTPSSRRR